jgi:hypothetical protein
MAPAIPATRGDNPILPLVCGGGIFHGFVLLRLEFSSPSRTEGTHPRALWGRYSKASRIRLSKL